MPRRLDDERRGELLDGVMRIIASRGFSEARVSDMARELHCSVATLYKMAPNKDSIVVLAIGRWGELTLEDAEARSQRASSAVEKARRYFLTAAEHLSPQSRAFRSDVDRFESTRLAYLTISERFIDRFVSLLDDAVEANEVYSLNTRFLAHVLRQMAVLVRDERALQDSNITADQAMKQVDALIWGGLRTSAREDGAVQLPIADRTKVRPWLEPSEGQELTPHRYAEFEIAVLPTAQLGEGPRWDAATPTLLWVDIPTKLVHRYDPATGTDTAQAVAGVVSLALPRRRGGVVIGLPDGLHLLDGEPLRPARGHRTRARRHAHQRRRLRRGRPPVGGHDGARRALAGGGAVPGRRRPDGVTTVLTGTTISNGLGWSPDGTQLLLHRQPDAARRRRSTATRRRGALENRRPLAAVEVEGAVPDGMTVDAEGCLWVALHGGWGLHRYSPDGELVAEVGLPVARITSCCFGGPELRDLYVTTRREGLSEAEAAAQPLAGALLRLDVGVAGLPTHAFAG